MELLLERRPPSELWIALFSQGIVHFNTQPFLQRLVAALFLLFHSFQNPNIFQRSLPAGSFLKDPLHLIISYLTKIHISKTPVSDKNQILHTPLHQAGLSKFENDAISLTNRNGFVAYKSFDLQKSIIPYFL